MHLLAERTILGALRDGGLLRGDVEAMVGARLGATFMPHGEAKVRPRLAWAVAGLLELPDTNASAPMLSRRPRG